jgi:hypothetical protein
MACYILDSNGSDTSGNYSVFRESTSTNENCSGYVISSVYEYSELKTKADFYQGLENVNSLEIAQSFTWGFGTYMFFWFLGYCIKNARQVIKKV